MKICGLHDRLRRDRGSCSDGSPSYLGKGGREENGNIEEADEKLEFGRVSVEMHFYAV